MLALATAAHGQVPSHILIILAAVAAALFWRALLKIGIAVAIILFAIVLINGNLALFHDLRQLIP